MLSNQEPYPDLTGAREAVTNLMSEFLAITFDEEGVEDEVLDEDTGELVPPEPDESRLYEGPGKVRPERRSDERAEQGGQDVSINRYVVAIPWDAPPVPKGAIVKVVRSARDKQLEGRTFVIADIAYTTFLIQRRFYCREIEYAGPRIRP
jgi:hypothetical protein